MSDVTTTTTTTPSSRTVDGRTVPLAGQYALDMAHSEVGFKVRHLGVGKVRGRFAAAEATIVVGEDLLASSVEVVVDLASISTGDEQRDGHLQSPDFFDVAANPTMTYRSTSVGAVDADGGFTIEGELTIKGITVPVQLDAEFEGTVVDPWGNARFGFSASTEINREDFGLTWNQVLDAGGVLVGKKVAIEIEGQAVFQG